MNQLSLVLKEIDAIQQLNNENRKSKFKTLNISKLSLSYQLTKRCFLIFGMAIAKCIGSSSIFSITNKHRMMGEHSR
ncbi:hypothetical protein BEN71_17640 [Acinetobacter wuhouensis]|nr:hypothetical protein BEN71_17640 [Acinetobacter wuhouensis]RZG78245.1 hypothetical protein EXE09_01400 [Acinetobacter sp. WCHAc060025]